MVTGDSRIFVSMSRPNDPSRRLTTRLQMSSHVSMLGIQAGALGSRIHPDPGAGGEGFVFANTNIPHALDGFDFGGTDVTGEEGLAAAGETTPSSWTVEQVCGVAAVAVIVPFILVSNLLVVVSVVKCKRLQVPTNYFIVSLAAVDIFVALVTPFVIMVEILPGQFSNLVLCLTPNRILLTACGVSVLTLATIAYDRHTALVNPLEYVSVMTRRKIGLLVALTWLYSTAIVWVPLPAGWYSQPRHEGEEGASCSFKFHDNAHILFLSAIFGPACVAISICYFRIYTVARHHARAIAAVESSVQHNLRIRSIMKDAKYSLTLALVIGAFLALWLPYLTCLLAEVTSAVQVSPWLRNYLTLLAVLNSGLNPWIYAYKNNEFRSAFRKVFQDLCRAGGCGCGDACFRKEGRRCSTMSDVSGYRNSSTATVATTASLSQHSRRTSSATRGRLSDVSCVLAVHEGSGREEGTTCAERKTEGGLITGRLPGDAVSTSNEALFVEGFANNVLLVQRRTSDTTEKRVSSLLSADSKAFIADLLSLYLHHAALQPEVSSSEDDGHNDSVDTEVTTHDLVLPMERSTLVAV